MSLTGAQKSSLRSRGQLLAPALKIGKEGASPAVCAELDRLLQREDLVKVRFTAAERDARPPLTAALLAATQAEHVGSVGSTALFYRTPATAVETPAED